MDVTVTVGGIVHVHVWFRRRRERHSSRESLDCEVCPKYKGQVEESKRRPGWLGPGLLFGRAEAQAWPGLGRGFRTHQHQLDRAWTKYLGEVPGSGRATTTEGWGLGPGVRTSGKRGRWLEIRRSLAWDPQPAEVMRMQCSLWLPFAGDGIAMGPSGLGTPAVHSYIHEAGPNHRRE